MCDSRPWDTTWTIAAYLFMFTTGSSGAITTRTATMPRQLRNVLCRQIAAHQARALPPLRAPLAKIGHDLDSSALSDFLGDFGNPPKLRTPRVLKNPGHSVPVQMPEQQNRGPTSRISGCQRSSVVGGQRRPFQPPRGLPAADDSCPVAGTAERRAWCGQHSTQDAFGFTHTPDLLDDRCTSQVALGPVGDLPFAAAEAKPPSVAGHVANAREKVVKQLPSVVQPARVTVSGLRWPSSRSAISASQRLKCAWLAALNSRQ